MNDIVSADEFSTCDPHNYLQRVCTLFVFREIAARTQSVRPFVQSSSCKTRVHRTVEKIDVPEEALLVDASNILYAKFKGIEKRGQTRLKLKTEST